MRTEMMKEKEGERERGREDEGKGGGLNPIEENYHGGDSDNGGHALKKKEVEKKERRGKDRGMEHTREVDHELNGIPRIISRRDQIVMSDLRHLIATEHHIASHRYPTSGGGGQGGEDQEITAGGGGGGGGGTSWHAGSSSKRSPTSLVAHVTHSSFSSPLHLSPPPLPPPSLSPSPSPSPPPSPFLFPSLPPLSKGRNCSPH